MKRFALALAAALPAVAAAQAPETALQSCRALAEAEAKKSSAAVVSVRLDRDEELHLERRARRLGGQSLAAVLSGHGAILFSEAPPVEMRFVCLAAPDGRALFFHWEPRRDAPVLAQCRRTADTARCLDTLLVAAEQALAPLYAKHLVEARRADSAAGNDDASRAFRASADAFLGYRQAECARRAAPGSDAHTACLVELTRRRALDLQ
ncbi:MAG: DUF1311 domain-containing protein [Burkholderiales bacterium]|nr:DUF1311 domain-containing protein [Burkholderiales bacterium]